MKKVSILLLASILLATACTATPQKIIVTFPDDGNCTMEGPMTIASGKDVTLEVIGNVNEQGNVGIAILRLDPDKTIEDLEDLKSEDSQPPWTLRVGFYEFPSDGNPHSIVLNQAEGPIYFLCMDSVANRGALGPIEVKE